MDAESESLIAVVQSKLIDQVRRIARTLHVAKRTEEAYVGWISRYLIHHRNQHGKWIHPLELGSTAVNEFTLPSNAKWPQVPKTKPSRHCYSST
jgi:hypothetical protein